MNMTGELHPEYIKSFGFKTSLDTFSGGDNNNEIIVRLHWDTYRYQCSFIANESNTLYLCDDTTNTINITLCDDADNSQINPEFEIFIENDHSNQLRITEIYVEDLSGYYYGIKDFCIQQSINKVGRDTNNTNCTHNEHNEIKYDNICVEDDCAKGLSIEYILDLFLNPNDYNEGIVSINNNSLNYLTCSPTKEPTKSPTYHPSTIKISEFGLITHWFSNSGPDDDVILTLYWEYQIFQCIIFANKDAYNTSLSCNESEFTFIGYNDFEEFKIKLFYNHWYLFRPTSLFVIDIFGNQYKINEFCGPKQYYYWDGSDEFPCTQYYTNGNKYSYKYLEIATNTAFLTTLYVKFIDDILSYPNVILPGLVYPAKIINFGLVTSNDIGAGNPTDIVSLRLYWDIYLYLCTLNVSNYNTKYICNISDTSQVKTHCSDVSYLNSTNNSSFTLMIENDDTNGIYIDNVFVNDESGYYYGINTFCLNNNNLNIGRNDEGQSCTDFTEYGSLSEYDEICIDRNSCGNNPRISIDFSIYLFQNPNSDEQGYVTPISEFNTLVCEPTMAPSPSPTNNPTTPTMPIPSGSPTYLPTFAPTVDPKIKSFGFKTHFYSNSGHNKDVILTLWWIDQIFQCIIPQKSNGTDFDVYFYCDQSEFKMISQELSSNKYKMKIYYDHSSLFRLSEIIVIDLDDNYYTIDTFCGAENFYYWDGTSDEEVLCNEYFTSKYNYSYIELATNTAYLTTIYVDFISEILNYPNIALPGELHPEYIKSFGFKTNLDTFSGGDDEHEIILRLHWDTYRYQCSLIAANPSTLYLCDTTNINTTFCDDNTIVNNNINSEFIIFIENDHSNQLKIDEIYVEDLSGYYYGISDFCISSNISYVGRNINAINCSFINYLREYDTICIEDDNTCFKRLGIEFIKDLFINPNQYEEGIVTLNDNSFETLTCSPTQSPTLAPTVTLLNTNYTYSSTQSRDTSNEKDNKSDLTWLWILLAILFVIFIIFIVWYIYKKKKKNSNYPPYDNAYAVHADSPSGGDHIELIHGEPFGDGNKNMTVPSSTNTKTGAKTTSGDGDNTTTAGLKDDEDDSL